MAGGTQGTGRTNFQVPEEMRNMAERSLTQARQALDNFLGAARRTAETVEQTTDKVQARAKDYGPEELISGGAKPPCLPGLCGAVGAGEGRARDGANPI